jgi:class III cytochrome C family protein
VLWFNREIVNTEFNLAKPPQKPGQKPKPTAPFSHEAHMTKYNKNPGEVFGANKEPFSQGTQSCLICHETGKTAKTRSDFFNEFPKTKSRQPSGASCVPCHQLDMQKNIGGAVTLESAKCSFCHSFQTIKARAARGVALPPPSHFRAPVLLVLVPPWGDEKPPAQNDGMVGSDNLAPPPVPPDPKPVPMGIIRLGDTEYSNQWGQHARWGVVENFNHGDHTKPKYAANCRECHHTKQKENVDGEVVLKCLDCHQSPDSPVTANKGGGVPVEDAYHGVPDIEKVSKAGCIECHKRYRDMNPDSKAPIKSPCSGCHTEKTGRLDPRLTRPRRNDWVTNNMAALTKWMRSSRYRPDL